MKWCACIPVYESNGAALKSTFDDGKYRPDQYKNDDTFYRFGYKVNAIETGDTKQHIETRLKNDVKGAYFVTEPNGATRFIQYIANGNGFNAFVRHQFGVKYARNGNNQSNQNRGEATQNSAIDRFVTPENQNSKQNFRQSLPKPITNRSLQANSAELMAQVLPSTETGTQRQYEVNDPDVDNDIRQNVLKPFLNLAKLKRIQSKQ